MYLTNNLCLVEPFAFNMFRTQLKLIAMQQFMVLKYTLHFVSPPYDLVDSFLGAPPSVNTRTGLFMTDKDINIDVKGLQSSIELCPSDRIRQPTFWLEKQDNAYEKSWGFIAT